MANSFNTKTLDRRVSTIHTARPRDGGTHTFDTSTATSIAVDVSEAGIVAFQCLGAFTTAVTATVEVSLDGTNYVATGDVIDITGASYQEFDTFVGAELCRIVLNVAGAGTILQKNT
jgi:hypothetical protein